MNEYHKKHSEGLRKELEEQSKHPYTFEQARRQVLELKEASRKRKEAENRNG